MSSPIARYYLYTLVFLHTFTLMMCMSMFFNHGLKTNQNFEASVRSRIKRRILPEIIHSNRLRRNNRRSTALRTLCSVVDSQVLCETVDENSQEREHSRQTGIADSTTLPTTETNQATTQSDITSLNRWTNHEREHITSTTSGPPTTNSVSRRSTIEHHRLADHEMDRDHHIESLRVLTEPGYHDQGCGVGYCRAGGICHYDTIINSRTCLCPRDRHGRRCESRYRRPPTSDSHIYSQYSRFLKEKLRHSRGRIGSSSSVDS